jgi:hypothetical protein
MFEMTRLVMRGWDAARTVQIPILLDFGGDIAKIRICFSYI